MLVGIVKQLLITRPTPVAPFTLTPAPEIRRLLQEFLEVFKYDLKHDLTRPAKHHVHHHIVIEGPPVHARFRCLAPGKLTHTKHAFWDMEQVGICQKASSP